MQELPPVASLLAQLTQFAANLRQAALPTDAKIDWQWRPASGEWSLTELVCHLRDVEREVHQWRFRAILAGEGAFLPGVAADEWAAERQYWQEDGHAALNAFLDARLETVALLTPLDETAWQRQGSHSFLGPTSLHELLNLVAKHDQSHWRQAQALLQKAPPSFTS